MSSIGIIARGQGGKPLELIPITHEDQIKTVLWSGDLAQMARVALRAGVEKVWCVRVNAARPATIDLGDIELTAQIPGAIGNGIRVIRTRKHVKLSNPVIGTDEIHLFMKSASYAAKSLEKGVFVYGTPKDGERLEHEGFLSGGIEGGAPLKRWVEGFRLLSQVQPDYITLGTSNAKIIDYLSKYALAHDFWLPAFVGTGSHATVGDMLKEARKLLKGTPYKVVMNMVRDFNVQTERLETYPSYYLAAYVAARTACGNDDLVNLPDLKFVLEPEFVEKVNKLGIITATFNHQIEAYVLS